MSRLSAKEAASSAAAEALSSAGHAREFLVPHLTTARDAVGPAFGHARDAVGPALGHARDAVGPALGHARKSVEGTLKDDVLPRVAAGLAATEPVRDEALRRGGAAIAALRGQIEEPPPARGRSRLGKAFIIVAVGAAAVAAWRAWKLPHDSDDWVHADTFTSGAVPGTAGSAEPAESAESADEVKAAEANGQRPAKAATAH